MGAGVADRRLARWQGRDEMAHRRTPEADMARRDRQIAWRARQAAAMAWRAEAEMATEDRHETRGTPISQGYQGSPLALASQRAEARRAAISRRDAHAAWRAEPAMARAEMMLWRA